MVVFNFVRHFIITCFATATFPSLSFKVDKIDSTKKIQFLLLEKQIRLYFLCLEKISDTGNSFQKCYPKVSSQKNISV